MEQMSKGNMQTYKQPTLWDVVSVSILMVITIGATGAILGWW